MKYWNTLLVVGELLETYLPKSGILMPFCSVPLKGLLYEVQPAVLSGRMAVELRARVAMADGCMTAERRHAREALDRVAIVRCKGERERRVESVVSCAD
jgi:hypothetical protein